ncbi:MAG: glycosyltransferase family 2 protein [Acutalibacteraceae bacterium]|nr:glycosyltransferase family 2 protein [Acutalibacteraceae bacterium]
MITIVVPVYNVEKYLSRCIDSILNQTYTDFELLLVDDGSPDNCGKICDEYAEKDSRIFVIHQKNGGLSDARNTGISWFYKQDRSNYITFLDSDDWLHPDYLKILMDGITENDVKISVCNYKRVTAEIPHENYDNINFELTSPEDFLVNHSWQYNYAWGKLYHKSMFDDVRYPVGKNFEDTFTTYKVLHKCDKIAYTDLQLYYYLRNEQGISRSPWKPSELVIFDAMQEQLKFYKEKGLQKAFEKEFQLFVHHHAYQIVRIKENKKDLKENKATLKEIKKTLRNYLKENKDKFNVHNMTYSYEAAYPVTMKLYALASKTKAKILRK